MIGYGIMPGTKFLSICAPVNLENLLFAPKYEDKTGIE